MTTAARMDRGANAIAGISERTEAGPLALYMRGEYQYASAIPAYNAGAQQAVAASDGLPYGWNLRLGTTDRVRPVEAYAAVNFRIGSSASASRACGGGRIAARR